MTSSMLRRQLKNLVQNFSEAEVKVREATSNDPWGPSSSQMADISDLTYNVVACNEIMTMLWKRLKDDKNWRHIHKSLTLLEYLLKTGDDRVLLKMKDNIYIVKALTEYRFLEKDGKDQGVNVREKAKVVLVLMEDDDKLKEERDLAVKTREKTSKGSAASSSDAVKDPNYKPVFNPGATGLPCLENIPSVADLTASFAARKEERLKQEAEKKEAERRAKMSEDELKWEDAGKGAYVKAPAKEEEEEEEEKEKTDPWGATKEPKEATDPWGTPTSPKTSDQTASSDPWVAPSKADESPPGAPQTSGDPFAASKNGEDPFAASTDGPDPFTAPKDDPFSAPKDTSYPSDAPKYKEDPFAAPKDQEDPFNSSSDPFNSPKDDPFNSPKDDPFNTPKDDPFNAPKDDPFNAPKGDPFNAPKDDPFNAPKDDPFNTPKEDPFNAPKDDPFNTSKDDPFTASNNDPFNAPKDDPFNSPKDDPFNSPKDDPFNSPKDDPFNSPKEDPFTTPKNDPFNSPKEDPFNSPKEDPFNAPKEDPFNAPKEDPFGAPKDDPFSTPKNNSFTAQASTSPNEDSFTAQASLKDDPFAVPRTPPKDDPFTGSSKTPEDEPFTSLTTPPKEDPFSAPTLAPGQDTTDPFASSTQRTPQGNPEAWEASSPSATASDPWETTSAPKDGDPWGEGVSATSLTDTSDPFGDGSKVDNDPWGTAASAPTSTEDAWGSAAPPTASSPSMDPFGDGASKASDPWGSAGSATGAAQEQETFMRTALFLGQEGASLVNIDDLFSSKPKQQRSIIGTMTPPTGLTRTIGGLSSLGRSSGPVVRRCLPQMSVQGSVGPFGPTSAPPCRFTPFGRMPLAPPGGSYSTSVGQSPSVGLDVTPTCGGQGVAQAGLPGKNPSTDLTGLICWNLPAGLGDVGGSGPRAAGGTALLKPSSEFGETGDRTNNPFLI